MSASDWICSVKGHCRTRVGDESGHLGVCKAITFWYVCGCYKVKNRVRAARANFIESLIPRTLRGAGCGGRPRRAGDADSLSAADEWAAMSHRIDVAAARAPHLPADGRGCVLPALPPSPPPPQPPKLSTCNLALCTVSNEYTCVVKRN